MKIQELSSKEMKKINGGGDEIINAIWWGISYAIGLSHNVTSTYGRAMSGGAACIEDKDC